MYLFLITFLSLYGGMHCYAYRKMRHAFRLQRLTKLSLILWMIFMTAIPILVRVAEHLTMEKSALAFAWPGYLWMGFIFIFVSAQFGADLLYIFFRLLTRLFSIQMPEYISARTICRTVLTVALCASIYAFFEAGRIRTEHVVIPSSKLPASVSKLRIVQISDVHVGLLLQSSRLRRIADAIREADPDIVVSTGDLIDGKLNRDDAISAGNQEAALLAAIQAPSGKFAIVGNHEVYAGLPQALAFTQAAGFTMLRNQAVQLVSGVIITGIDDQAVIGKKYADPAVEQAVVAAVSPDLFHLLLKHRPDILPESDGRFDLQLSGHVHGGQIFPFNYLVRLKHPIPCGTTATGKGSRIHVSRGTGTWGPPMRLLAPPEITIIDIEREQHHQ